MFDRNVLAIVFGIICVLSCSLPQAKQINRKNRITAIVIICILFIVQAGFRDYQHSSNDTYNYLQSYNLLLNDSLSNIVGSISFLTNDYSDRDPGYSIFVKLTQIIWPDFRFLLVLVATIISIPICRIIYKYTLSLPGIFLAAVLYEVLFAGFFETAIRQTIAMGLSYMSFLLYQKNKFTNSVMLMIIALTFHTTALIFLPFFILPSIKNQKQLLIGSLICSPVLMAFANQILTYVGQGTLFEQYVIESTDNLGTPVFTTFVFLTVLTTIYFSKKISSICPDYNVLFSAMVMALVLTPASWVNSNFIRITFYYLIFLMPLLSVILEGATLKIKGIRPIAYIILVIILTIL